MKPRYVLATTSLISALAGAPAMAGPLGIISGGAGAVGSLTGTVSGFGANPALSAGGMAGAMGQFQGAVTPPNLVIERAPLERADDALQSVKGRARNRIEGARDRIEGVRDAVTERSTTAAGEVTGAAAAAGQVQGSGDVGVTKSLNPSLTHRPLRSLEASGSAQGEASASARGEAPAGSASAEAGGSAQTQAQVKR